MTDNLNCPVEDTHYEWELQDSDGEWVAGGSGNELGRTLAEGTRYLLTYKEDGQHRLVIRKHETSTVYELICGGGAAK